MIHQRFFIASAADQREFHEIDALPEFAPHERPRLPLYGGFRDQRHTRDDAERFLEDFIARNWAAPYYSSPLYATSVRYKVRAAAVRGIFESMVNLSDNANLMEKFLALPLPRMFMYGEQNRSLSYLPRLAANGVQLAEIPRSGHFPMYSNAPEMWNRIAAFQRQAITAVALWLPATAQP